MTTITLERVRAVAFTALASMALAGCVSLGGGGEAPASLLTLTSNESAPSGSTAAAGEEGHSGAIAVLTPEVPAKLDVLRVPVNVSETQIAYLQEAYWVDKPARLFRRLLGERMRSKASAAGEGNATLVLDSDDTPIRASAFLRGTLSEMGYDAPSGSVIVRFDAIRSDNQGAAGSRRFEARIDGVAPQAAAVGPALNSAANQVAAEVADWVLAGS